MEPLHGKMAACLLAGGGGTVGDVVPKQERLLGFFTAQDLDDVQEKQRKDICIFKVVFTEPATLENQERRCQVLHSGD